MIVRWLDLLVILGDEVRKAPSPTAYANLLFFFGQQ